MRKMPRYLLPIAFWVALVFLFAMPVRAFFPSQAKISENSLLSRQLADVLGARWFQRKEKILKGGDRLGREELDAIYEAQLDRGIKNIPLLASLLIRESLRALDRNDIEGAEALCEYAKRYAPDFPAAYFTLGRIRWAQSKVRIDPIIRYYIKGVYLTFRNFTVLFFKLMNVFYRISGALVGTFVVFAVIMGVKHLFLYVHDVKKEFDLSPTKLVVGVLKACLFLVPVVLGLNLLWSLLYWTFLIWGYMGRRERQMIVAFLFILVYMPWLTGETGRFLELPNSTLLLTVDRANQATWDEEVKNRFDEWSRRYPQDTDVLFTLGLVNKREGRYDLAKQYYEKALQIEPEWAECVSNLGNVYLSTGRREEAIAQYERAISLSPRQWSAYFNLHRAISKDSILSSERGGQALEMANKLNPGLVAFYTQIYSDNMNRVVADNTIPSTRLWDRLLGFFQNRYGLPEFALRPWVRRVSTAYGFVYPVFFLAFLVLFSLMCSRRNFPKRCPVCGTPSLKFFPRKIQGDTVCFGCHRLFVKRESIDPKMREKKMKQVNQYGKRKAAIARLFCFGLPGVGHIWKGQPVKGSLFVFFVFVLVLKFLHWNGIVSDPFVPNAGSGVWVRLPLVLVFLGYYLVVLKSSLRIKP